MINDEQLKAMREDQPPWLKKQEGATGPQQKYMATLIESREVPEKWLLRIKELTESEALTKRKASDIITSLKALPFKQNTASTKVYGVSFKDIPAGYYALPVMEPREGQNDIVYFRVKKPKGSDDKGWVHSIHGPDEGELKFKDAMNVLLRIKKFGLGKSAVLYGKTIGVCQCKRRLTNKLSRELGIGPVCGGRVYGEDWHTHVIDVRQQMINRGEDPDEKIE
jgi:hypothetical protein